MVLHPGGFTYRGFTSRSFHIPVVWHPGGFTYRGLTSRWFDIPVVWHPGGFKARGFTNHGFMYCGFISRGFTSHIFPYPVDVHIQLQYFTSRGCFTSRLALSNPVLFQILWFFSYTSHGWFTFCVSFTSRVSVKQFHSSHSSCAYPASWWFNWFVAPRLHCRKIHLQIIHHPACVYQPLSASAN